MEEHAEERSDLGPPGQQAVMKAILGTLRHQLAAGGVTQAEVARRCGLTDGHVSSLLSGRYELKVDQLLAWLAVAGVPAGAFFGEVSWVLGTPRRAELPPGTAAALAGTLGSIVGEELREARRGRALRGVFSCWQFPVVLPV